MSINYEDLTPEQKKVYDAIAREETNEQVPLEERTIEAVHPEDARRELESIYDRLAESARAYGGKRETKAQIGTPTNRQGIALDAVLSELTRISRKYPELEPFIKRAMQIAHEGLTGASSGQGNRIELPE